MARTLAFWVLIAVVGAAQARAAGRCGYAYNFGNAAQARVRLKGYRVDGDAVRARLVCTKWQTIFNGKSGRITATVGTCPGTDVPRLSGSLTYGTRLTCGVFCQVDGTADAPNQLFCQFNCPPGSAAVQVSFTVGRTVCQ